MQLNPATHEARTQGAKPLRPFFLSNRPKGKENKQPSQAKKPSHKAKKARAEDKSRPRPTKGLFAGLFDEMKGETRHKPLNRLTPHAHKSPHKPSKAPRQHKPTQNPQTALKTPLKREIEPYSSIAHQEQSSKAGKRHGTHDQRTRANLRQVLNPRKVLHTCTKGHAKKQTIRTYLQPFTFLTFKNILGFCRSLSPNSRGLDKNNQIFFEKMFVLSKLCVSLQCGTHEVKPKSL